MLTPQFANILTYFYAIGNTPAVCLTQGLPKETEADILLLGCGDVRNILFTAHVDARRLDITCCDHQPAVLARNILLLTLVLDDADGRNNSEHWDIYYHVYLNQTCVDLIRAQAEKLGRLSASLSTWGEGEYGKWLRFCDSGTLERVAQMWAFYAARCGGETDDGFKATFESNLQRSREQYSDRSCIITAFRSALPVMPDMDALRRLHAYFWEHGTADVGVEAAIEAVHANPTFASPDRGVALHYGSDPLLGFHLATASAPLTADSPLRPQPGGRSSSAQDIVAAVRTEFFAWLDSFRERAAAGDVVMRVFAGDAIAFSHALQCRRTTADAGPSSAHWYRDRHQLSPLVLDGGDYVRGAPAPAPLAFTAVDTSNLADHVGPVNLLVAASPLLRGDDASAGLYVEVLARREDAHRRLADNLLCGPLPTVAALLGLVAVEYWTGTSPLSAACEMLPDLVARTAGTMSTRGQMFVRTTWKRPIAQRSGALQQPPLHPLSFDAGDLAHVLHRIYLKMFEAEDVSRVFSGISILKFHKLSTPQYHRASFASLLHRVQGRVTVDWEKTMRNLLDLIEGDTTLLMGRNYIQELYLYMHLFGVHSVDTLRESYNTDGAAASTGDLRDWRDMPSAVCVTLKVPRTALAVFSDDDPFNVGTPYLQCVVQVKSWQNIFAAVQTGFGELSTDGARNSDGFEVHVSGDARGWHGNGPLFVSFMAPTWVLLLQPRRARVKLGLLATPQNGTRFAKHLGWELVLFEATLGDIEHVYVSKHMPNQHGPMRLSDFAAGDVGSSSLPNPGVNTTIEAGVNRGTGEIVSLTAFLNIRSKDLKSSLSGGCRVQLDCHTPCNLAVSFDKAAATLNVDMPLPVSESRSKLRIARKSCYVEVVCPVDTAAWKASPALLYPVLLLGPRGGVPAPWNMPHLALDALPILDTSRPDRLAWLNGHAAGMFSARERALRERPPTTATGPEAARVGFKDTLFTMLMLYSGVQGSRRGRVFAINDATAGGGGVHVLIFVSGLRLDLPSRAVVLDAAVLALHRAIMPGLRRFLAALTLRGAGAGGKVCPLDVDPAQLRLWKRALPAMVERCRRGWTHGPGCEYAAAGCVPRSLEFGAPVLCSCGAGTVPDDFMGRGSGGGGSGIAHWADAAPHLVRAAISPAFWCPMVDDAFDGRLAGGASSGDYGSGKAAARDGAGCRVCGNAESRTGGVLLVCAKCRGAKYCSRECQRADWKSHKAQCTAAAGK